MRTPTGTIVQDAILSIGYGFSRDSKGAVTVRGPTSPGDVSDHLAALAAEFSGWTFK